MQPGFLIIGPDVRNSAGHGNVGDFSERFDFRNGILADDPHLQIGNGGGDGVVHLGEIPAEAIHVWIVIHGTAEKDSGTRFLPREFWICPEVGEINAVGDNFDRSAGRNVFADEIGVIGTADDL